MMQTIKHHSTMIQRSVSLIAIMIFFACALSSCQQQAKTQDLYRADSALNTKSAANSNTGTSATALGTDSTGTTAQGNVNNSGFQQNLSSGNIPEYQQDFMNCLNFLTYAPVDYANPEGRRCYNVVYKNCHGCRVDENLRPIDSFSAYGFSGTVAWPAHEDWWPELSPYLSNDHSYIAYQSPYFNGQGGAYPQGAHPPGPCNNHSCPTHYPNGSGTGNPLVYCANHQGNEPCQLDAVKVWSVSAIDKSYQYNLAPGKNNQYVYTIVQPLNQPCSNQYQVRQSGNVCDPRFRSNLGNLLGGLKTSGANIAGGLKASGKAMVDGLGASLMASVPSFTAGSLVPTFSGGTPTNYTVSQGGHYAVGSPEQYTMGNAGHYSWGGNQNLGMYAGQEMAVYGQYLNYTASQNRYTIGGSVSCNEQYRNHPGYVWACQDVQYCQVYGGC